MTAENQEVQENGQKEAKLQEKAFLEINMAKQLILEDMLEEINPQNFVNLCKLFPIKFLKLRSEGIRLRIAKLQEQYEVVDDDADERVARDIKKLQEEASEIYRTLSPEKPSEDYQRPFTLTSDQLELLQEIVDAGWVEALTVDPLPFIKRIPREKLLDLTITAYQNAIKDAEDREKNSQPTMAVPGLQEEPSWINKRSKERITKLKDELYGLQEKFDFDEKKESASEKSSN